MHSVNAYWTMLAHWKIYVYDNQNFHKFITACKYSQSSENRGNQINHRSDMSDKFPLFCDFAKQPQAKALLRKNRKFLTYRNILAHNIHVQFWTFVILVADSYVDYLIKNIEIFNKNILKITISYFWERILYTRLFSPHVIFDPLHLQTASPSLEFAKISCVKIVII